MENLSSTPYSWNPLIAGFWVWPKFTPSFVATIVFLLLPFAISGEISYSDHCSSVVPDPSLLPDADPPVFTPKFLALRNAYVYSIGSRAKKGVAVIPKSLSFSSHEAYRTKKDDVFRIQSVLTLIGVQYSPEINRRGLRLVHFRPPRIPVTADSPWNSVRFQLSGLWDSISGKICMVGSGTGKLSSNNVVLRLDYLNSSNIFTSFVNGTLESVDLSDENGFHLNLISILGVNLRNYKYELIDREINSNGFSMLDDMSNVSFGLKDLGQKVCKYIRFAGIVELEYESDCSVSCNFLGKGNGNFTPSMMYFDEIACLEDGQVRFLLGFGDFVQNMYRLPFVPNVTLISEGKWDEETRRLNMVACHIFTDWDESFVGECSIRLSLRFPSRLTLQDRSAIVGELWSSRSANESGYFGRVSLSTMKNKNARATSLGYDYTELEKAKRFCANKTIQKGGGKYPDALSSDMRFDMVGENKKVKDLWGYSSPFFVDNQLYQVSPVFVQEAKSSNWQGKQNISDPTNVSYILRLLSSHDFELSREYARIRSFEISAEGTYNSKSGHLCMTGCLDVVSPMGRVGQKSSLDCEILVDIQYLPIDAKNGGSVRGTIESMRNKSDSHYFEPFKIYARSIYAGQAKETIWSMDLEITMALISSTLSCIFTGLQLVHVKNHADVVPVVSIVMLGLLTLGHLIPLLLNFEALFMMNHNNVNVRFGNDGWLEVNEVFVRVITMVAFLLEFRLLQMTWSSRSGDGHQKNLMISDKNVLYLSLPLYIVGGLMAWFAHLSRKTFKQHSLWGSLKSYGGLILDGFLLPQTLFNLFSDSSAKALTPPFYVGTTLVRLLPHIYDLYRSHRSVFTFNYMYANPRQDYYSTTWDLIISTGSLVFVLIIYLQQRYGGRCLLPKRLWRRLAYEKVPVSTTV